MVKGSWSVMGCREREKGTVAPRKLFINEGEEGIWSGLYCWDDN